MPRIVYGARRLRFAVQGKEGVALPIQEAADGITAVMRELSRKPEVELTRQRLNNIELGSIAEIKGLEMLAICTYYSRRLERTVQTSEVMEYDPNNKRAPELAVA
jgi:hypothetical protein